MRSDYVDSDIFSHVLAALTYPNRLAVIVSMLTGLRINDVLHLKTDQIMRERFTVKEQKTGKSKRIRIPQDLRNDLIAISGRFWVFEGRIDPKKPRTRQAVFKDIKRAAKAFRVKKLNISPHSARKIYAVTQYRRTGDLKRVQELLNHSDEAVTLIYALADEVAQRKNNRKR